MQEQAGSGTVDGILRTLHTSMVRSTKMAKRTVQQLKSGPMALSTSATIKMVSAVVMGEISAEVSSTRVNTEMECQMAMEWSNLPMETNMKGTLKIMNTKAMAHTNNRMELFSLTESGLKIRLSL